MSEMYRDEARVESVGRLAATIKPVTDLPPNVADFD